MDVLVIGGNRFVGRLAAGLLLDAGHRVALLHRGLGGPDPFGGRAERLLGDRTGPDLGRLLRGRSFDAVLDMAAFTAEDGRVAAALLHGRVGHYVMVSSGQVYLVREGCPRPAREEDFAGPVVARPRDPGDAGEWDYGMGKRACEDALAEAHAARGFPATIIRIPMVNGELDNHRRLESYLWRLADGGPVLVPGGGDQPMRHVDGPEVARALVSILGRAELAGRSYNLAQEETPTLRELLGSLRILLGSGSELVPVPVPAVAAAGLELAEVSPFSSRWMSFVDPARARAELDFTHRPLASCLERIAGWFTRQRPAAAPPGYRRRVGELRLAAAVAT